MMDGWMDGWTTVRYYVDDKHKREFLEFYVRTPIQIDENKEREREFQSELE